MGIKEVEILALSLMSQYKLIENGWVLKFNYSTRSAGSCNYTTKTITLSKSYFKINDEYHVKDVILHEIAHALVGPGYGHSQVWEDKALGIGCTAKTCVSVSSVEIKGKWTLTCPVCGRTSYMFKKPRAKRSCGACSRKFNPEFLLKISLT